MIWYRFSEYLVVAHDARCDTLGSRIPRLWQVLEGIRFWRVAVR